MLLSLRRTVAFDFCKMKRGKEEGKLRCRETSVALH